MKNSLAQAPYQSVTTWANGAHQFLYEELASYVANDEKVDWRPNEPFEAELELVTTTRGRSSVTFIYRDVKTNIHYPLFISTLEEVLLSHDSIQGRIKGVWVVVKRGQNYGLRLVASD